MSDIQELIHKTTMDSIEKGQSMERERIIELLSNNLPLGMAMMLIRLIKGETNE